MSASFGGGQPGSTERDWADVLGVDVLPDQRPTMHRRRSRGVRIIEGVVVAVLAAAAGLVVGVVLGFGHRDAPPWGLVVALATVTALIIGLRLLAGPAGAAGVGLGVLVATVALGLPGPGGSILIAEDPLGEVWVIAPTVIAVLALFWPSRWRRARPATA